MSKMAATVAILKFLNLHLLPNHKSDWAETWWEASEHYRDSELLKSFRFDNQDGSHGGRLVILQTTSSKSQVGLSQNLMEGIGAT